MEKTELLFLALAAVAGYFIYKHFYPTTPVQTVYTINPLTGLSQGAYDMTGISPVTVPYNLGPIA